MPKDRRIDSLSSDRSRSSPYPCSSYNREQYKTQSSLGSAEDVKKWENARCPICVEHPHKKAEDLESSLVSVEDVKAWEEVRCPICMEHPHNAVLLQCSSFEKGCQPYICNTSYRHSNCLDKFCKSSVSCPSTAMIEEIQSARATSNRAREEMLIFESAELSIPEDDNQAKLYCPLCRGEIYGWFVVAAARQFMNSKARTCSCQTCDFSGNYTRLRKHARTEHPSIRPSEVDSQSQLDWASFVYESDLEDLRAMITQGREWQVEEENEMELEEILGMIQQEEGENEAPYVDWSGPIIHIMNLLFFNESRRMPGAEYDTVTHVDRGSSSFIQRNSRRSLEASHDQTNRFSSRPESRPNDNVGGNQMESMNNRLLNSFGIFHLERPYAGNDLRQTNNFRNNPLEQRHNWFTNNFRSNLTERRSHNRQPQRPHAPHGDG